MNEEKEKMIEEAKKLAMRVFSFCKSCKHKDVCNFCRKEMDK